MFPVWPWSQFQTLSNNFLLDCIEVDSRMIILEIRTLMLSFLFHAFCSHHPRPGLAEGHCSMGLNLGKEGFEESLSLRLVTDTYLL